MRNEVPTLLEETPDSSANRRNISLAELKADVAKEFSNGRRSVGKTQIKWSDDLVKAVETRWTWIAQDRPVGKTLREALLQQWKSFR